MDDKRKNHKPRIGLLTHTIDGRRAAGTALVERKCIEVLLARRDEFELTFIHYEKSDDPIYGRGVREVILPEFRPRFLNRRFFRLMYYFFTTKDKFDIMQWFQSRLYPFFWLAPAEHTVVSPHGAGDWKNEDRFIFSRLVFNWTARLFNKKTSMAIAGSDHAKKDIVEEYGFDEARVTVIHNGAEASYVRVNDAEITAVRRKYGLPEKFFLGVARLIPTKNVIRTIRAFEIFASAGRYPDMHFVHVGSEGSDSPHFERILEASPVKNRRRRIRRRFL